MIPLHDNVKSRTRPWVSWGLMAGCVAVFAWQFLTGLSDPAAERAFVMSYGMIPAAIVRGRDLHTLVTSMFLHGGILHLLGNMWYLWIFGDNVEDRFGRLPYLLVYLASGLFGSLLHILIAPQSPIPTIGASGAISGVMGAYLVLFPKARVLTLVPIVFFLRFLYLPASFLLGFWILMQVLYGCAAAPGTGGVAYFAHIGGFAVGVLAGLLARRRRPPEGVWYDIR
ncbi:MAG: rhomboid family intramembrane serine protease [bacterium]